MKIEVSVIIDIKDDPIDFRKLKKEITEILDKEYFVEEVNVERRVSE